MLKIALPRPIGPQRSRLKGALRAPYTCIALGEGKPGDGQWANIMRLLDAAGSNGWTAEIRVPLKVENAGLCY